MLAAVDGTFLAMGWSRQLDEFSLQRVDSAINRFVDWLAEFGPVSFDHQSYFAGPVGGRAKALYYRNRTLGTLAVAPMIFSEAFLPQARVLFWRKQRFPIADAHYAMGFALLAKAGKSSAHHARALEFLDALEQSRSPDYEHYCWGYPFDWVTRNGVMKAGTPLITTTPYAYEAFAYAYAVDGNERWREVMHSIAEHAADDIEDREISADVATAGYAPHDKKGGVVNASAYRAFLLTSAAITFDRDDWREKARRNVNFVLQAQRDDGSWPYAVDGVRPFVDHFHTCFVMKALAKIEHLTGNKGCTDALEAGVEYYVKNLFDENGTPRPFSEAPRMTVYKQELYDCAEAINIGVLLKGRFAALDDRLGTTLNDILGRWQRRNGSFRSRRLIAGWDNVPMHRWAQSQLFRSLCLLKYLETTGSLLVH